MLGLPKSSVFVVPYNATSNGTGHTYFVRGRRDRLRSDPSLAADYTALKRHLAEEYASDKIAYTAAKTNFVQAVLQARQPGAVSL